MVVTEKTSIVTNVVVETEQIGDAVGIKLRLPGHKMGWYVLKFQQDKEGLVYVERPTGLSPSDGSMLPKVLMVDGRIVVKNA